MSDKQKIYEFLKQHKYMTLATADTRGRPEAATVEYVLDGDDLLINTYTHYQNIKTLYLTRTCLVLSLLRAMNSHFK